MLGLVSEERVLHVDGSKIPSLQLRKKQAVLINHCIQCVEYCYDIGLYFLDVLWRDLGRLIFLGCVFGLTHIVASRYS
jgi:hypothetical protein